MNFNGLKSNVVYFRGLKRHNIPYVLVWVIFYAWIVAFASWWTASPNVKNVFGSVDRILIQSALLTSSLVFMFFIKKKWFVKVSRIIAAFSFFGLALFFLATSVIPRVIGLVVFGISLGCVSLLVFIPMVFRLNNTEKLYASIISNICVSILLIIQNMHNGKILPPASDLILFLPVVIIAIATIIFINRKTVVLYEEGKDDNIPKVGFNIYSTLFFNASFVIICIGIGVGVLNTSIKKFGSNVAVWYFVGGVIGCVIFYTIYALFPKAILIVGNISFGFVSLGFLCSAFGAQASEVIVLFALLLGIGNGAGMIVMFYVIWIVGKKINSLKYLKLAILFVGIIGGVGGMVLGNLLQYVNSTQVSMFASIISALFLITFMIMSPLLAQEHIYDGWAKDTEIIDIDNDKMYLFEKYQLSKREIEVCRLLLKGHTLRQISAMLSISYSTVNTYCTNCYRKLNINSRTELLILFKDYIE